MANQAPSPHHGMGAYPVAGGTSFRVWAPFASRVSVAGNFNGWTKGAHPLAREAFDTWSTFTTDAGPGAAFQYVIERDVAGRTDEYWRIDPRARAVTHSAGDAIVVEAGAFDWGPGDFEAARRDEMVVYELHVGSFNDPAGGGPGNFGGVIARLDYLRDLGVTHLELLPSMEFSTDFSWGYNPSHIFAIEQAYGGMDALKVLIRAAHEHGLGVILDVVYNHLGPMDLHVWRFDGWDAGGGGIYFYNDWRRHTRWGDTRPDYGRAEVRQYLRDNAAMWLEEFRADALRWDATAYVRNVHGNDGEPGTDLTDGWLLMQEITGDTRARQPWKFHIAEDLRGNAWITRDAGQGGAGFAVQWDSEFAHAMRRLVLPPEDGDRDLRGIAAAIRHRFNGDALQRIVYTESHDEVANGRARLPEDIHRGNAESWYARKRSTLAAGLLLTTPGIPMLFQGQEFVEDRWFHDQDPLEWDRASRHAGIVSLYRDLVRLRRNWHDTTRGLRGGQVNVHHVNDATRVLAFHRWVNGGPRDDVLVVANAGIRGWGEYLVGVPRGGRWRVRLNSDASVYAGDFGDHPSWDADARPDGRDGLGWTLPVSVGPYSVVILSQDD